MPHTDEVAVLEGSGKNVYATINTTAGRFHAGYRKGQFSVLLPDGSWRPFDTPGMTNARPELDIENGVLVAYYIVFLGDFPGTQTNIPDRPIRRLVTDIPAGSRVVDTTVVATGPMGPMGPAGRDGTQGPQGPPGPKGADAVAVSDADARRIAEAVYNLPPAPDNYGLPAFLRFGNRWQQMIAIMLWNQAAWQSWFGKMAQGWQNWRNAGKPQ